MPANFLSLPSELRNNIYEQILVLQEPIPCQYSSIWCSGLQSLTPSLLRANKTIHIEASTIFYGNNHFDFSMCTWRDMSSFFEQIGRHNASYILHICIKFPKFYDLQLHDVHLETESVITLVKIYYYCTGLVTLTTSLDSTNDMEVELDALDYPKIVEKALALVDALLRSILPLRKIIVQVYEDGPSGHIRRRMEDHGWTINTTKYVESELDYYRGFSDIEGHYDDDGFDDDNDDEYDIDNDSDFWRRATD